MKTIKRTVAALLATLMLATSTSFVLAAEDTEDLAIAKVNAAGIMTGTDKGFEPEKSLTRAEAAAIIVRMKGITEATVKAAAGTTNFDDVAASHWAAGYINQASNLGIVKGVSATSFAPDKEVTVQEMVTMAVRALGAGTLVDSEGVWPSNYINFAAEEGILDGVAGAYASVSTRLDAARVVANCLEANMWVKAEADTNSKITYKISGNTILNDVLDIDFQKGMTVSTVDTKDRHLTVEALSAAEWAKKDVEDYTTTTDFSDYDVTANVNLAAIKTGDEVDVWFKTKSKEVVGVWAAENTKQTKVAFTEIVKDSDANKVTLKVNGNEKKYSFAKEPVIVYNEKTVLGGDASLDFKATDRLGAKFDIDGDDQTPDVAIYKNKANVFGKATIVGGDIVSLYLEEYTNFGLVKEIKKDKVYYEEEVDGANATYKFNFSEDFDTDEYVITKDGKEVKALEEGDAIEFYQAGTHKYVINVLTDTKEGKITASSGSYIKLDDAKVSTISGFALSNCKLKDEITAYLNEAGKIVMAKVEKESEDADFGIVTSLRGKVDDYGEVTYELAITNFENAVTEVMALDKVKTYDKLAKDLSLDEVTKAADKKAKIDEAFWSTDELSSDFAAVLGTPVRYDIVDGKIVLAEMYFGSSIVSAYKEDKIAPITSADVDLDNNKVDTYKVTDNTVILLVEDGDEEYESKVKIVNFDDLSSDATVTGYVVDVNEDTNKVKYIVATADLARTTDDNFGIIKSVAESAVDDEVIFELFTAEGVKEVAVKESKYSSDDHYAGVAIQYNKGDLVTDITVLSSLDNVKVIAFNDDNIRYTIDDTNAQFIDCEEDVFALTYDSIESSQYKGLKATTSLPDTGSLTSDPKMDGAKACNLVYRVEDGNEIVVAVIYAK